ncbi:ABC transporter ATP-binding protein [Xanthomonas arboricola]|uniref:ABC transporter ATP-binding protein n=1 Tax=Xanthomonas arboricola TaxID=56448 RepID=UPI001189694D|nr:ABC transporter ATP-binding protein [Xanthomonas arboricola]QDS16134.1 ABC transporter ATP-binding protein [Xanthomonas arboricola]
MIELKDVSKIYRKNGEAPVSAVDRLSLTISKSEFIAIVGPSGSGKSTLMNLIGLLDRPDAGQYLLNGRAVQGLSDNELASLRNGFIGFVFQSYHLLPRTTALENVQLPLLYANRKDFKSLGEAALAAVGLSDRMSHYASELSGGQQQRVAIARALVNEPKILLADEPTGNLDKVASDDIMNEFRKQHDRGTTIVLVTHDPEVARRADRVITISGGVIVDDAQGVQA